jgi:hypothetical protein
MLVFLSLGLLANGAERLAALDTNFDHRLDRAFANSVVSSESTSLSGRVSFYAAFSG